MTSQQNADRYLAAWQQLRHIPDPVIRMARVELGLFADELIGLLRQPTPSMLQVEHIHEFVNAGTFTGIDRTIKSV